MKKIGIIGAMEMEVEQLKKDMTTEKVFRKAGMDFYEGRLAGTDVVVVRSGIGKVNAAVCTQILADSFEVDAVLNTGVAGSLDASIDIGDIVISTDVVHHDVDAGIFGYAAGQVPQMKVFAFPADEELAALTEEACRKANPEIGVVRGRVASGDQFISDPQKKNWIHSEFGASCTEMEGAAIAQTAWLNDIPFVIMRAISDKADNSAQVEYPVFEAKAAACSIRMVEKLLEDLAEKD